MVTLKELAPGSFFKFASHVNNDIHDRLYMRGIFSWKKRATAVINIQDGTVFEFSEIDHEVIPYPIHFECIKIDRISLDEIKRSA